MLAQIIRIPELEKRLALHIKIQRRYPNLYYEKQWINEIYGLLQQYGFSFSPIEDTYLLKATCDEALDMVRQKLDYMKPKYSTMQIRTLLVQLARVNWVDIGQYNELYDMPTEAFDAWFDKVIKPQLNHL